MAQDGAHRVHLRMRRAAIAARAMHFFQHCRRCCQPKARAAIFFRDQDRQPAFARQRGHEFCRVTAFRVQFLPIGPRKPRAKAANAFADV